MPRPVLAGALFYIGALFGEEIIAIKPRGIDLTGRIGLRVHEFAAAINVAPRTVYAWIDHGELEAEKHGRLYIIPAKVVKKFTGGDNIN